MSPPRPTTGAPVPATGASVPATGASVPAHREPPYHPAEEHQP
ncbi:hypothetical protein ABZ611_29215 [Streptomyces sp. NPDC007861]